VKEAKAELYRLKGELLLTQEGTGQHVLKAEECLGQTLSIARQQQAKSWELRAATSLAQ
jgi:hypothetical protein